MYIDLFTSPLVQKNKELYELVTTLQDDVARCEHHIKELEETLHGKKDDLAAKVNELTKRNMKLERSMQAKQVFSEKLLKENKKLTEIVEQKGINQQMMPAGRDIPDGQAADEKMIVSFVNYCRTLFTNRSLNICLVTRIGS